MSLILSISEGFLGGSIMKDMVLLKKDGAVAEVILNRPEIYNAYSVNMMKRLKEVLNEVKHDGSIRVVIIYGAGHKAFSAGGDIDKDFKGYEPIEASIAVRKVYQDTFTILEEMPSIVIAAVNGYCLGGGLEMALCSDIRLASKSAIFGSPEVNLGILPGAGGTQRLPRYIGDRSLANDMLLTGKRINGDEAYRVGLVSELYDTKDELLAAAREKAAVIIAKTAPIAVSNIKKAIIYGQNMDLNGGLRYEGELWALLYATEDQKEAMTAFKEKRQANFKGK